MKMKSVKFLAAAILICMSCSDDDVDNYQQDAAMLLHGGSSKQWSKDASFEDGVPICLSTCERSEDKLTFNASGKVNFPSYNCSLEPCETGSIEQIGGDYDYSLSADQKTLVILGISLKVITLTNTSLIIEEQSFGSTIRTEYIAM